ncbi:hypothetical protein AAFF_G00072330 [Aldrovandia affinis]|uniref:PH domain-containing protein n=1 Tax=Aldrovandia affinis TaxID=143900 RepID=A0AAD7RYQ1_9TELE|nr:hypothetical protein AAFF_G00072330 [Aldrovandia affinis]
MYENDRVEKEENNSLRKESFSIESDEREDKEHEIPSKEKIFRKDSHEGTFRDNRNSPSISEAEETDESLRITTSVMINDRKVSSSRIVFQQSCESADREQAHKSISVTTTKVVCSGSKVEVQINEVVRSDNSDFKITFVVRKRKGRRKGAHCKMDNWATPNNEKFPQPYSVSHNIDPATYSHHRKCESRNYKFSISEMNMDFNKVAKSPVHSECQEEMDCCKSCYEDRLYSHCTCSHNDYILTDKFSSLSTLSDACLPEIDQLLSNAVISEALSDIPPPQEFADGHYRLLNELTEDIASCQINSGDKFDHQRSGVASSQASEDTGNITDSGCQYSVESESFANQTAFLECLSESNTYDSLFLGPNMPMSRSSYTKKFIHNQVGTKWLRNNSIAILETKPRTACYLDKQAKRRQTFPGPTDCLNGMQETMPLCRESFSSGTLSSFFMQSLPLQAERVGRFHMDDERSFPFSAEGQKSSDSSTSYKASSSNFSGYRTFLSNISAYGNNRNPFYPSGAGENQEEIFDAGQHIQHREMSKEVTPVVPMISLRGNLCVDTAGHGSNGNGQLEHSQVAESGFDEDMVEAEKQHLRDLLIQVTPLSLSNSEELITKSGISGCQTAGLRDGVTIPKPQPQEVTTSSDPLLKKRRGSVLTIIIGGCEKRTIQTEGKPLDVPESSQRDVCSAVYEAPVLDMNELETDENSDVFDNTKSTSRKCLAAESSASIQTFARRIMRQGKPPANQKRLRQGWRVAPTDIKVEAKEHLRPPADSILKDQEDVHDRWEKRRKLFKESKQWSSAGGSSFTSNITEESVNSEDGRSVDISVRDIEERGFYTETFHSASWIYRGDNIYRSGSPRCLSDRPRPVTNGTAEEAGLLVGDSVLTVNGTDVTSAPHSEAADLARQGPDILTLTIGSDISRCPNTPQPACRGYLHKRTQSGLLKGWRKRWFVLKHDGCLYYYRHKRDEGKNRALSAMKLEGAEVGLDTSLGKLFVFKCNPVSCARVYYFCATSNQEMKRWLEAMDRAVHPTTQNHVWIDVTRHNSNLPPLAIKNPECLGLLHQMDKNKDAWVQYYCILKDGCLYFYTGIRSTHAIGGIFLHGYAVWEQGYGSRCSTIELKPPSEEFKSFHLCAESATENKR